MHLVYSGKNIHVESKGHASHFEIELGRESESCTSQMNIVPAKLLFWRVWEGFIQKQWIFIQQSYTVNKLEQEFVLR